MLVYYTYDPTAKQDLPLDQYWCREPNTAVAPRISSYIRSFYGRIARCSLDQYLRYRGNSVYHFSDCVSSDELK